MLVYLVFQVNFFGLLCKYLNDAYNNLFDFIFQFLHAQSTANHYYCENIKMTLLKLE